jgi:hypothetical protein
MEGATLVPGFVWSSKRLVDELSNFKPTLHRYPDSANGLRNYGRVTFETHR